MRFDWAPRANRQRCGIKSLGLHFGSSPRQSSPLINLDPEDETEEPWRPDEPPLWEDRNTGEEFTVIIAGRKGPRIASQPSVKGIASQPSGKGVGLALWSRAQ